METGGLELEKGKKKTAKKHIVVFQDETGNVLKTAFVSHGKKAEPPEIPSKKGETAHHEIVFQGWDQDYHQVEDNLVVKAIYKEVPKKYLVMFYHENGKMLGMEAVPYGSPAKTAFSPVKKSSREYDYIFKGWNVPLDCITEDTNVKAVFEEKRKTFIVSFYHEDGRLLKEEEVFYGASAHPPENVTKADDEVYYYRFSGWSVPTEKVTESLRVQAIFENIYKEYTVTFFDNGKEVQSEQYHYGTSLVYPDLKKKGYDLSWDIQEEVVEKSMEISAKWTFSNTKGKIIDQDGNRYVITNPSITNGGVCCISYRDSSSRVVLPERVKLGDYYYRIEEIGSNAFSGCDNMSILILPDTVHIIHDKGLSKCRRLKSIIIGKGIHSLGNSVFGENVHLKDILIHGQNIKQAGRRLLEDINGNLTIWVKPGQLDDYSKLFHARLYTKKIKMKAKV